MNLKKLDLMCIVLIVIVLSISGYWTMSRVVRQKKLIELEDDLLLKRSQDLSLAETNLQRLKNALAATKKELNVLNDRIPDSAKIGEFLKQFDSLIKERNIGLINLQPLPSAKEKLFTKIPIRMMIKGSFLNIYRLLHDLETMTRVVVIERMTISKPGIVQDCQVDVTANLFER